MGMLAGAERCCHVTNRFSIFIWRSSSRGWRLLLADPRSSRPSSCPAPQLALPAARPSTLTSALCHLDLQELLSMVGDGIGRSGHRAEGGGGAGGRDIPQGLIEGECVQGKGAPAPRGPTQPALLFDPAAWLHGPPETSGPPEGQVRLQTLDFSGRTSVPSPLIGWLPVGRVSLNLHSNSGAIALSRPLEAENPLPTATPWMGLRWAPGRSLG